MGTTLNRAIPYIEPADQQAAYPAADKAQADRLDVLFGPDTGWQTLTLNAGFVAQPGQTPQYRRIGSVVYVRGAVTSTGLVVNSTKNDILTVAAGLRPLQQWWTAAGTFVGTATGTWNGTTAGGIHLVTGAALSAFYSLGTISWLID